MLVVKKSVSIMEEEDDDCGDTILRWMMRMMVKKNFNLDIVKLEDDDANSKRRRLRHIQFSVTIIFISSVIACQAFISRPIAKEIVSMVADYTILSLYRY